VDPNLLARRLQQEPDESARQAIVLSLGEFPIDALTASVRQGLIPWLRQAYRNDSDPGVHSSVDWLFRRWDLEAELRPIDREVASALPLNNRRWYVRADGHTMAVISDPEEFWMGSPGSERGRVSQDEAMHRVRIPHSYAIATTEVTTAEFKRFLDANPKIKEKCAISFGPGRVAVVGVTWYEAAQFCRWLSEQEKVSDDQMCYPRLDEINEGMKVPADCLDRTGYRLPTDEEWEYACRFGTGTSRPFGSADEMLENYAWYVVNSGMSVWPVAQLKPNDAGLFDILGNVGEWCHGKLPSVDHRTTVPSASESNQPDRALKDSQRVWRGGSSLTPATRLRSAAVAEYLAWARTPTIGFRVARTLRQ
jgi:formylglycine-generating enzyme required for sulfatase activity